MRPRLGPDKETLLRDAANQRGASPMIASVHIGFKDSGAYNRQNGNYLRPRANRLECIYEMGCKSWFTGDGLNG
jgi:hypothetical protein